MLLSTPNDDILYKALIARDDAFEGRAFVGVTSTGIFCRLTCPARKPKRENCLFFENQGAAIAAGFRACKRCRPMAPKTEADPIVVKLMDALDADPGKRRRETDIRALGVDPSTARRAFRRTYGATFLEIARAARIRAGANAQKNGARVIDAQIDAGFESASGYRAAFTRLLGDAPAAFAGETRLKADWIDTPVGAMIAVADDRALHLLEFFERKALAAEMNRLKKATRGPIAAGRTPLTDQIEAELGAYFSGDTATFKTPLALHGGDFTRSVWTALRKIPVGVTRSYQDVATEIGRATATRAVARANGANQIAIVIPCHRVIGADGSLTGYGGGLWRKNWLIEHEATMRRRLFL